MRAQRGYEEGTELRGVSKGSKNGRGVKEKSFQRGNCTEGSK